MHISILHILGAFKLYKRGVITYGELVRHMGDALVVDEMASEEYGLPSDSDKIVDLIESILFPCHQLANPKLS